MQDEIGIREVNGEFRGRCAGISVSTFLSDSTFGCVCMGEKR